MEGAAPNASENGLRRTVEPSCVLRRRQVAAVVAALLERGKALIKFTFDKVSDQWSEKIRERLKQRNDL
jgi:hypothetical protein